jgi:hypothetical protein
MEKKRLKLACCWQVLLPVALFAILAALVAASIGASAVQENGPVYSMEGAWYGVVSVINFGEIPSLDTFTSDAQKHGVEGTFLCTVPPIKMPNPLNPGGWPNSYLTYTPSGHGNWVRIDKNRYAFTAVRTIFNETGQLFGWARFWGTITPISESEYTGTMNYQFYALNGTPLTPLRTGTLHSHRVEIAFE